MPEQATSEYIIESLTELFHLVKSLVPQDQEMTSVAPDTPVAEAVQLMQEHRYSQLPVIVNGTVLGVFTYRSFTDTVLRMGNINEPYSTLPVDEFVEEFAFVQPSDHWEMILDHLNEDDAVLVGGRDNLKGLVSAMDVLAYLRQIASPLVLIAEIETSLRRIIRACVTSEELHICAVNSLSSKYKGEENVPEALTEMDFNDYAQIIGNRENWSQFSPMFGNSEWVRKTTASRLYSTRELRNVIFHFKRKIEQKDVEKLTAIRDWLQRKARAFEARHRPSPQESTSEAAAVTDSKRKWNEKDFFTTLQQNARPEEVKVARQLLEWARQNMPEIWWGEGRVHGSFVPGLTHDGSWHQVIGVWTNGYVEFKFQYMQGKPLFDDESARLALLRRFSQVPGIHVDESRVGGRPSIPLSALADDNAMDAFIDALNWYVRQIESTEQKEADTGQLRYRFWEELLEKANERTLLHANVSPLKQYWIGAGAGISGLSYNYVLLTSSARIELYIDRGEQRETKEVFQALLAHRDEIEERFGEPLEWQALEDKQASRVQHVISDSGLQNRKAWPALQDKLIDAMDRFSKALQPAINELRL